MSIAKVSQHFLDQVMDEGINSLRITGLELKVNKITHSQDEDGLNIFTVRLSVNTVDKAHRALTTLDLPDMTVGSTATLYNLDEMFKVAVS